MFSLAGYWSDIFGKMNLSSTSVTLTTCLCTGISTVLPGQAVKDSIASWPLHNSVPVLTKFKTESLNFLQNFTSQLFRPTVWDIWSRIWASNNWHCWHCWAFCFSRIANLSIVSLSPWTISLNKCRLCGILIWDSFLVIILRSASIGQNVISTDTASRWTRVEPQLDTTKVL